MVDFGVTKDYNNELKRIITCVKQLRSKKKGIETDWHHAAESHIKYSNLNGESVLALTVTLSPTGCEWAREGGCTMCGEFEGSVKRQTLTYNPQFHISQFAAAIGEPRVWEIAHCENKPIEWLRINQEGNYINTNEMNFEAQEIILRLAMRIKGIKRITIESRPQYITQSTVNFLKRIFEKSNVELEVGMGVEAQDEVVRNICINKQGSNEQYKSAVSLLRDNGILPLAYVLLKPPFLTEQESIDEAVKTAHFAKDIGFSRISFEPMSIHYYTLVHALTLTGDYRAPWLWSVIEVAKRCSDISHMFGIGGVGYFPVPQEYSSNQCLNEKHCSGEFAKAIVTYNKSRDVSVFNHLSCDCKQNWEATCKQTAMPLRKRMQEQLTRVEEIILDYNIVNKTETTEIRNKRLLMAYNQ